MTETETVEIATGEGRANTKKNKITRNFTIGTLFLFALPSILLQVWTGIYTMVASAFSAVYISTDALAAVNMAYPILAIEEAIGGCIATGAAVIIAEKLGEGKKKEAGSAFSQAILWSLIIGVVWAVGVWLLSDPVFMFLGADEVLLPLMHEYYDVYVFFAPVYGLQIAFQALMVSAGKPTAGLVVTILSGILNVVITWVCLAVLDLGIIGMSLGEGLNALFAVVVCIVLVSNKKDDLHLGKPTLQFRFLGKSIYIGSGALFYSLAMAFMTVLFNIGSMQYFGADGEAAGAILLYAQFLFTAPFYGLGMGTAPVIAYRYGCLNVFGFQKLCNKYFKIFGIVTVVAGIGSFFMADPLMLLYGQPEGDPVYVITKGAWMLFSVQYLFAGVNYMTQYLFAGVGDGKFSGGISALHGLIFPIIFLAVLPMAFGGVGVWAALPVSEILACIVSFVMIFVGNKKYHYLPSKNPETDRLVQADNDKKIAELKAAGIDIEEQAISAANEVE